jgi:hypothetical protein
MEPFQSQCQWVGEIPTLIGQEGSTVCGCVDRFNAGFPSMLLRRKWHETGTGDWSIPKIKVKFVADPLSDRQPDQSLFRWKAVRGGISVFLIQTHVMSSISWLSEPIWVKSLFGGVLVLQSDWMLETRWWGLPLALYWRYGSLISNFYADRYVHTYST